MSVTLAIESAIAGGSLSLIRDGEELGNWIGRSDVSKAEELLVNIEALLTARGVSKYDLDLIAVSAGPGSFTGIRIGIATAIGLKAGLGIPMTSVSALEAICRTAGSLPACKDPGIIVAVPMGRNSICIQSFEIDEGEVRAVNGPRAVPENMIEQIYSEANTLVMHSALFGKYAGLPNVVDSGANIALAVGSLGAASPGSLTEPLFISKSF